MCLLKPGLLALILLLLATATPTLLAQPAAPPATYLPLVSVPQTTVGPSSASLRVNSPYYSVADLDSKLGELAIFWFGKVTPAQNYADVRLGHNDSELFIYAAVFDRRLWYDNTPQPADLGGWDALTLYLETGTGSTLSSSSHRFVAQFSGGGGSDYQAAYRASGGGWTPAGTAFTTRPGWRGDRLNDDGDDRGWAMTFRIPFASLGLDTRPPDGATWRMALALHDRDDAAGTAIADQTWPPDAALQAPATWGTLTFGMPGYTPPTVSSPVTISIRQGAEGASVPDAAVGGGSVCGDGLDFWSAWGESSRDTGKPDFNIQNQADIADWPCFSKYYVTFPLSTLPAGRAVTSARLVLHQFGNSDPSQARPSLIQVLTVGADWQEQTLSWNSAPLATENVGAAWVAPVTSPAAWPGIPREFDITRAVAQAYAGGGPLRLALYSSDSSYHSGKYFVSSDTGDWNAAGRPTLVVTLGTPTGD